nr:hypothetical protein [Sphingomonas sp. Y57]
MPPALELILNSCFPPFKGLAFTLSPAGTGSSRIIAIASLLQACSARFLHHHHGVVMPVLSIGAIVLVAVCSIVFLRLAASWPFLCREPD